MAIAPDKRDANATIAALADLFPAAFSSERWQPHKPPKIGVDRELIASGVLTEAEVHAVLGLYVRRYQYLVAVSGGGLRYDLNGNPAGQVTLDERQHARIGAAHVGAHAENQFRNSRARHKARSAPQPAVRLEATPPTVVVTNPRPRLGLANLRRLGHERKVAATNQNVGAPN